MCLILAFTTACTEEDITDASENILSKLNGLFYSSVDGVIGELVDPETGYYYRTVDSQKAADVMVSTFSLGANFMPKNRYKLPNGLGSIEVATNPTEGHYYHIYYNVRGFMSLGNGGEAVFEIVDRSWMENHTRPNGGAAAH